MENINISELNINENENTNIVLYTLPELYKAKIIKRPSSQIKSPYVSDIILCDSNDETIYLAHCPSLGCCGLCETDSIVYVSKNNNPKAKCDYIIQQAYYNEPIKNKSVIIGTAPKLAEKMVHNALVNNYFLDFKTKTVQSEKCFKNSRFDFCGTLEDDIPFILEVKTVPIAHYENIDMKKYLKNNYEERPFESKIAYFPVGYRKSKKEPISPRAIKHLEELAEIKKENPEYRCMLCFVIQRIDVECFQPSTQDTFYLDAIQNAVNDGVEIKVLVINWCNNIAYLHNNNLRIKLNP